MLNAAVMNPASAAYTSAADLARVAEVNTATVTRAAQALGFSGWPEFRQEIRARYIRSFTAPELATLHDEQATSSAFGDTIKQQIADLNFVRKNVPRQKIKAFAKGLARGDRRIILAWGSSGGVGRILAHHCGIAGYRSEFYDDSIAAANGLADCGPRDVVVIIMFWRLYNPSLVAAETARRNGAKILLISDSTKSQLAQYADLVIAIPAEGASYFPALVPCLSVIESVCSELEGIDVDRTRRSISLAEAQWQSFNILRSRDLPE
ncbi:MurR/RpiR family transcriptional regulator [Bosea sp. AK1]|uniref:MurR/RpiR family transcriptional regulator n=1 Tax=Bosea sp. AK1 TaxID=2587160 RepID=UPI001AEF0E45|nr:MurR/RpiR family transcriptional regulator [Bosea sp. AK1]